MRKPLQSINKSLLSSGMDIPGKKKKKKFETWFYNL